MVGQMGEGLATGADGRNKARAYQAIWGETEVKNKKESKCLEHAICSPARVVDYSPTFKSQSKRRLPGKSSLAKSESE